MTIVHPTATAPRAPHRTVMARRVSGTQRTVAARIPFDVKLFLAVVFLIPVQLDSGSSGALQSRISPSDLVLAVLLLMMPGLVRLRARAVDLLPIALVMTLAYGTLLALFVAGDVTSHTVKVKLAGSLVLALLAIVTATYARAGWGELILKSFLVGMVCWAVVAYVDWKFFDLVPFVDPKTPTRFGGMQFDPNNAGAAYAAASLMTILVGLRLFARRLTSAVVLGVCAYALGVTLSRGGYLSAAAGALVVLIVERPAMQRNVRLALGGLVLFVGATLTGVVSSAVDDFARRPDTVRGRNTIAENGIAEFVSSHGTGIGLGTFRARYEDIIHNTALWMLVEMSFVGLALLLLVAVVPTVAVLGIRRRDRQLGNALLGGHIVMLVASTGIEALYQRPWWLFIGLIAGVSAQSLPAEKFPSVGERRWRG